MIGRALLLAASIGACRAPARESREQTKKAVPVTATPDAPDAVRDVEPPAPRVETGPFEIPYIGARTVYVVAPHAPGRQRLMAMLHGVCNPPAYACGLWAETAKDLGFLVCPTGNGSCGPSMYNAPTWSEPDLKMSDDLEKAISKVGEIYPAELSREDAVLLGFSLGAYVSVRIAAAHPGRWPYLVLIEANVQVSAAQLRAAGVRAVALIGGELGSQLAGERKTAQKLAAAGFPAKLWVMPKAGHHYSADIDSIMKDAITWVTGEH
jgi:hypothetical protein